MMGTPHPERKASSQGSTGKRKGVNMAKPENPEQRSQQLYTEEENLSVEQREALEEFASCLIGVLAEEVKPEESALQAEFYRCITLNIHQSAIAGAAWDAASSAAEQVRMYGMYRKG